MAFYSIWGRLYFDLNLFLQTKKINLKLSQFVNAYEQLANVLYLHARDEYLSGRYLVKIEVALELVGLQLAIEFGPFNGNVDEALDLI